MDMQAQVKRPPELHGGLQQRWVCTAVFLGWPRAFADGLQSSMKGEKRPPGQEGSGLQKLF